MSGQNIKTSQQGVYFESIDPPEYYHSSATFFNPNSGKINLAWWENDKDNSNIYQELAIDVTLVKFSQYPVAMAINDASGGKVGLYFRTKDPRTWKVGIVVGEDDVAQTIDLAFYNEADPEHPTIMTAPSAEMFIDVDAPFFIPNPLFSVDEDIAIWMTNN